jgi:hypothetical protein
MNPPIIAFMLLAACLLNIPCYGQESVSDAAIVAAIQKLSSPSDSKPPDDQFQALYKNPERSTELLIAALKPASRGNISLSSIHRQSGSCEP